MRRVLLGRWWGLLLLAASVVGAAPPGDPLQLPDPVLIGPLEAEAPPAAGSGRHPDQFRLFLRDLAYPFRAPAQWDRRDRRDVRDRLLWVIGGGLLLDRVVRKHFKNSQSELLDTFVDPFEGFGDPAQTVPVFAALYLGAQLSHDRRTRDLATDALFATAASGLFVTAFKEVVGRSRPYMNEGSSSFHPFSGKKSFPSGHVITAFTLAGVVDAHHVSPVIRGLVRAGAVGVALERLTSDKHWFSDVLAGALLGEAIGRSVVRINGKARRRVRVAPMVDGTTRGVVASVRF